MRKDRSSDWLSTYADNQFWKKYSFAFHRFNIFLYLMGKPTYLHKVYIDIYVTYVYMMYI